MKFKKTKISKAPKKKLGGIYMTICGAIASAVAPDCDYPMVGSLEVDLYLANKEDIASYTFTGSTLVISAITMASTKKFYKYTGKKTSNNIKVDLAKGKYNVNFDHSVELVVFKADGATEAQIEQLANGLVVAIIETKYKGAAGAGAYKILGREQGLEMSVLSRDPSNADSQGAYTITLKTPDQGKEGHLPAPFFDTDYATTAAKIAALI